MEKPTQTRKFYVETFGCQMNLADSEEMGAHLEARGLDYTSDQEDADVVLLNTCTVRQHAEDKALSFIGRLKFWKGRRPGRKIVVAGCAAENLKKDLKRRFPQVDLVVGAKSIGDFPDLIQQALSLPSAPSHSFDWFNESESTFGEGDLRNEGDPFILGDEATAFVTIMRGCNYSCSYCIVPAVRGREIYRPAAQILKEVKAKVEAGAREVMLLGQTVNSYWFKEEAQGGARLVDFAELLQRVHKIEKLESIKFMSPHPHYMSAKLIETLGALPKIHREIHLPVQSGSNAILKAMKRNYTREEYVSMAQALKESKPDLCLSTDFIVGFPGETEEDFEATLSLAREAKFTLAYCFKYSPRAGTESAQMADEISDEVKEARLARLLGVMEEIKEARTQGRAAASL